jgi:YidC/Oxa1 family membrane protein insertase
MPFVFANIFQPLINIFESVLVFIHDHVVSGSWGLAIIGLTVVVRAALLPLTLKQFRSMQALQRLAPEIKELQAKYKDDKQRLNQEMMKFYQENHVNPFSSCLPLVAQLPVFLALFYMLRKDLKADICPGITAFAQQQGKNITSVTCSQVPHHPDPGFLFINDLTAHATGAVLIVLIVLYVGSQLASSLLMSTTMDKTQRRIMLALPLVFVTFIINFPAGLIVYWITTNLWTIGQQYIVKKTVGPIRPVPATAAAGGGGGGDGGTPAKPSDSPKRGGGGKAAESDGADGDGGKKRRGGEKVPAAAGARGSAKAPPPPPRKRKKRSGRRR